MDRTSAIVGLLVALLMRTARSAAEAVRRDDADDTPRNLVLGGSPLW